MSSGEDLKKKIRRKFLKAEKKTPQKMSAILNPATKSTVQGKDYVHIYMKVHSDDYPYGYTVKDYQRIHRLPKMEQQQEMDYYYQNPPYQDPHWPIQEFLGTAVENCSNRLLLTDCCMLHRDNLQLFYIV